jgi:nuclear transport factor 2 (NTF2) superfamily protein
MPEAIRLAPMETPAAPVLDEVAAALVRLGETAWGDMRAAMADVARAYGTGYPSAKGYAAQREEVSAAMEGAQQRAWAHRERLEEVAAYLRGKAAVPAWWNEHGLVAGGREVEGKGKGRETERETKKRRLK